MTIYSNLDLLISLNETTIMAVSKATQITPPTLYRLGKGTTVENINVRVSESLCCHFDCKFTDLYSIIEND